MISVTKGGCHRPLHQLFRLLVYIRESAAFLLFDWILFFRQSEAHLLAHFTVRHPWRLPKLNDSMCNSRKFRLVTDISKILPSRIFSEVKISNQPSRFLQNVTLLLPLQPEWSANNLIFQRNSFLLSSFFSTDLILNINTKNCYNQAVFTLQILPHRSRFLTPQHGCT